MKKFWAIFLTVILATTCIVCLTACNKKGGKKEKEKLYADVYTGQASEQTYDTQDECLNAFVQCEISGISVYATFVSYKKQADLTQAEIGELNLSEAEKADVISAEKGSVNYVAMDNARAAASESNVKSQSVTILKMRAGYKYYVPKLENGEYLTQSYFNAVYNPENYYNCTITENKTVTVKASAMGQSMTIKVEEDAVSKSDVANKMTSTKGTMTQTIYGQSKPTVTEIYFVEKADGVYKYMNTNGGEFSGTPMYSADTIEEVIAGVFEDLRGGFDATFYQKDEGGFVLRQDKFELYMQEEIGDTLEMYNGEIKVKSFTCKGYVDDNMRLYKYVCNIQITITIVESGVTGTAELTLDMTQNFSDFGTTTITVPDTITSK